MDRVSISFPYYFSLGSTVIFSVAKIVENPITSEIMFITAKYLMARAAILKLFKD